MGIIAIGVRLSIFLFFGLMSVAGADIGVEANSADIDRAVALIGRHLAEGQNNQGSALTIKEDLAFFDNNTGGQADKRVLTTFNTQSPTIEKHIKLGGSSDQYAFMAILLSPKKFTNSMRHLPWGDALIFDDGNDLFIYTQNVSAQGHVELKEWVYARKPNGRMGSHFRWFFKPELWGWPLTVEIQGNNQMALYRNMPVNGVKMINRKQRDHVAKTVTTVMDKALGEKGYYFPFHDKIADMPAPVAWTLEGAPKQADIAINDEPMKLYKEMDMVTKATSNPNAPKAKKSRTGPDWSFMASNQQNVFDMYFKAKAKEYPLLIDPTVRF